MKGIAILAVLFVLAILIQACGTGDSSSGGCTVTTIPDATGNGSITTQVCN